MKIIFIIIAVVLVVILIASVSLAIQSQCVPTNLGLHGGELRLCPDSPNCVCSEKHSTDAKQHFIKPIRVPTAKTFEKLKQILVNQGATVITEDALYVHATFTSTIFRFVDDVEIRFDPEQKLAHIRSASRMGHSDFDVNRKRMEKLREAL